MKTKISCAVCQDLMPLVTDDVASPDSRTLVANHIQTCSNCQELMGEPIQHMPNDPKVLGAIKQNLFFSGLAVMVLGAFLGIIISDSLDIFYNLIIMPGVGALGYLMLGRKWYLVPLGILGFTYIWHLGGYLIAHGIHADLFLYPLLVSHIYAALSLLGVAIAKLLKYAFLGEEKYAQKVS